MAIGERRRWIIGPLRLRIAHLAGEWRVTHRSGTDPLEGTVLVAEPDPPTEGEGANADEGHEVLRFARSGGGSEITLRPALADRPIVSHPAEPFFVLPGDETRLFVHTPLWIGLGIESPARDLCEFPILRPSDTWVGSTTGSGQIAYASRTHCRMQLEDLPFRPHRALTIVHVRNRSSDPLRLERITVSVPNLSLYASREGRLWTDSITLTREADDPQIEIRIADRPPAEADVAQPLAPPRRPVEGNRLWDAFDSLF